MRCWRTCGRTPASSCCSWARSSASGAEWSEEHGLDWHELEDPDTGDLHHGVHALVCDLNAVYRANPALWTMDTSPGGYSWIDANDTENNVLSFLRYGSDGSIVACLFNFSGSAHAEYRVGLPEPGRWVEILNTDALSTRVRAWATSAP